MHPTCARSIPRAMFPSRVLPSVANLNYAIHDNCAESAKAITREGLSRFQRPHIHFYERGIDGAFWAGILYAAALISALFHRGSSLMAALFATDLQTVRYHKKASMGSLGRNISGFFETPTPRPSTKTHYTRGTIKTYVAE